MNRIADKEAGSGLIRHACRHAAICHQGVWFESPGDSSPVPDSRFDDIDEAESETETEEILFALAQAVEQRDSHTAGHCERLALIGVSIGFAMGLELANLLALYRGGYLHDVGKVGIPDSILFKPGGLTASEWVTMRSHTVRGEEICRHMRKLAPVLPIIRHHHERWDGGGYPDGLSGEQIPLLARILQIADIYDALISPRPYKPAYTPEQALVTMKEETAKGWRDPSIMGVFTRLHKDVISKVARYNAVTDSSLQKMQSSLGGLQRFLAFAGV
jgi:putative two-component system response regulator